MSDYQFESAAVIGTGMMGPGIAVTLAVGGLPVTILSRKEEGAQKGLEKARDILASLAQNELVPGDQVEAIGARLSASTALDEVTAKVDLIVESAPENLGFKQQLFAHLDRFARPSTVLTSNTSGISITAIATPCRHPERILTTHFWNPPHLIPLVEVVLGGRTAPAAAQAVKETLQRCGKMPVIVKKDTPGQLGNRLQMALWREAVHIVSQGIADVEDVDNAIKASFGMRMPVYGIFEHADAVGLDMVSGIMEYVSSDLFSEKHAPHLIHDKVRKGDLGKKSGRGFYDWSNKDFDEIIRKRDKFLVEMLRRKTD